MGISPHRVEQPFQPVKRGARVADDLLAARILSVGTDDEAARPAASHTEKS